MLKKNNQIIVFYYYYYEYSNAGHGLGNRYQSKRLSKVRVSMNYMTAG